MSLHACSVEPSSAVEGPRDSGEDNTHVDCMLNAAWLSEVSFSQAPHASIMPWMDRLAALRQRSLLAVHDHGGKRARAAYCSPVLEGSLLPAGEHD